MICVLSYHAGLLEFNVFKNQSASVPLGGSYTLSYGGANTTAIPHDAEEEEASCHVIVFHFTHAKLKLKSPISIMLVAKTYMHQ